MALNCSNGRKLSPLDEGRAFERLLRYGFEVREIADRVGRSLPFVYDRLKLCNMTPEVKAALEKGAITIKDAARAAKESGVDPERQNRVVEKPKPIRVVWNKKKETFITKTRGGFDGVDNLGRFIFSGKVLSAIEEAGLDPATIKLSILPKTSGKRTKKGPEQKSLF